MQSNEKSSLAQHEGFWFKLYIHTVQSAAVMGHQRPPQDPIIKYRIPIPADPQVERAYLDIGWKLCGNELMWSFGRGTPVHPDDSRHLQSDAFSSGWLQPPTVSLLQMLPVAILAEGIDRLPPAYDCESEFLEVPVMVLIKYKRGMVKKGKGRSAYWVAEDAKLIAGSAEPPI